MQESVGCEQHQALLLELSHQLRDFFRLFPSVSPDQTLALCPEIVGTPAQSKWTLQQLYAVRASLTSALRCVFQMFSAVEERWQAKYGELEHKLERAKVAAERAHKERMLEFEERLREQQIQHESDMQWVERENERHVGLERSIHSLKAEVGAMQRQRAESEYRADLTADKDVELRETRARLQRFDFIINII